MPSKNIVDFANQVKSYALGIKDQQVLGVWNELENNLVSTTVNGVTYTKKSDGTVDVTGQVTTGQTFAHAEYITTKTYPAGTYYYSDGLTGDLTHKGTIIKCENNSGTLLINTLQGITSFTLTESHKLYVRFYRDSNETGNYTIKPMLAPKPNQPYVPYAMTNRELTDMINGQMFDTRSYSHTDYSGDCNSLPPGIVYATNSATNRPADWCVILTFGTSDTGQVSNFMAQVAFQITSQNMYYRNKANSWSAWKKVTLEAI